MSIGDVKLFCVQGQTVTKMDGQSVTVEKELQALLENHLETFFAIRFLASEYKTHKGRIDTLGLDEKGCPVIVEYKRRKDENVVSQVLSYRKWLLDHQADFELLVQKTLGRKEADKIDWSGLRLLCIAGRFTSFDEDAATAFDNVELVRYTLFGDDLMLMEPVFATAQRAVTERNRKPPKSKKRPKGLDFQEDCIQEIEKHFGVLFTRLRKNEYTSTDGHHLVCKTSHHYEPGFFFWYGFHKSQVPFLQEGDKGYIAFGCGSRERLVLMPAADFLPFCKGMNTSNTGERLYWHVKIFEKGQSLILGRSPKNPLADVTKYLI